MSHPAYIREKAVQLRTERGMTIDEIAERLALGRTTIYYWVRDIPIERKPRQGFTEAELERAAEAISARARIPREAAYRLGAKEFPDLSQESSFRDFVCIYIGEGTKSQRNVVAVANSDPRVVSLANCFIRRHTANKIGFGLQYHADQDLSWLRQFWAFRVGVEPEDIRPQRKSNSGRLGGRNWRSRYGVLTVRVGDTYLRAKLQAWMDLTRSEWAYR